MASRIVVSACVSALVLSGCVAPPAAITVEPLSLASAPSGAHVIISDGASCTTPCTLSASRIDYLRVTFVKPGCMTQTQVLPPGYAEPGLKRAAAEVNPDHVFVSMSCGT